MNMDSGCIFSSDGKCMLRVDISTVTGETWYIDCDGYIDSKSQCPEWGPTIAAENYYKAKIRMER